MSFPNYVWVRIMFPLAKALVASTKVCIQGRGDIVVSIRYESIPFFCFICGQIGHSNKECPNGEVGVGEFMFGVELRASPPKRIHEVRVQPKPMTTSFLNFEGTQHSKLQDEASSTHRSGGMGGHPGHVNSSAILGEETNTATSIPHDEERDLMRGVKDIYVNEAHSILVFHWCSALKGKSKL
jgi:hypothetical protein